MKMFYSPSAHGFFPTDVFDEANMPQDVLEISLEEHKRLFEGQSEGKQIVRGPDGLPCLVDPVVDPTKTAEMVRRTRNTLLKDSDWTQLPDVPENMRVAWAQYRQQLRDVSQQPGFPVDIIWPKEPQ